MSVQTSLSFGRGGERAVEGGAGVAAVAERHVGAAARSGRHRLRAPARRRAASRSAPRASPCSSLAWASRWRGLARRHARPGGRARSPTSAATPSPSARCDPRLHDPRRLVVGIGLERVQELDPRGADVARARTRRRRAHRPCPLRPEQAASSRARARRGARELHALQPVLLEQIVERRPADPEQLGGAGNVAVGLGQRLADDLAVGGLARGLEVDRQAVARRRRRDRDPRR